MVRRLSELPGVAEATRKEGAKLDRDLDGKKPSEVRKDKALLARLGGYLLIFVGAIADIYAVVQLWFEFRRWLRSCSAPVAAAALKLQQQKDAAVASLPHGGVVMYCTSWCPACRRARAWFAQNNIEFTEVDINAVPVAAEQVKKWANGNRTTPTFDIDGEIIVEFNEARLRDALKDRLK